MNNPKQNAINFVSLFIYFGLIILTGYLLREKGVYTTEIPVKELIIITLASFRLTRIIIFEKIFKFFRDFIKSNQTNYFFNTIKYIISCPWCAGVWVTLIIIVFYFFIPYGELLVYILAISGIASFIVLSANLLGLSVEKKQSERPPHHTNEMD